MSHSPLPDFDALWDFGKPSETECAFRGIADSVGETADAGYLFELETQIARTLGLQRKFDEAHATLDAIDTSPEANGGRPRVRYLLERGRVYNSSGHKASALGLFIEAWELGKEIGEDGLAVDAAHMAAIAEAPEAALDWNLRALELATSSAMPSARKWRKSLHNNLGWTFFAMGEFDRALYHFVESRQVAEETGDKEAERIARWCIAKTYRNQGRVEEALEMQKRQLADLQAEGRTGPFVFEELAECLYVLGRLEEATPYFARAYEGLAADPWVSADEPARLERLGRLAGLIE